MWETIRSIYTSVQKTSSERIKSPFYGVFILTWLACNWKPVAILLFSDMTMEARINFITLIYPMTFWLPLLIAATLAMVLPVINEKFTAFQSRPISRTSVIMAVRRKRALVADISVERFRAKRDVTYNRFKAGAEKEIQDMRESILNSQVSMGKITAEKEELQAKVLALDEKLKNEEKEFKKISSEIEIYKSENKDYRSGLEEYKEDAKNYKLHIATLEAQVKDIINENEKLKHETRNATGVIRQGLAQRTKTE